MQVLKWWVGALALLALACGEVSETSTPVVRDGEGLLELPSGVDVGRTQLQAGGRDVRHHRTAERDPHGYVRGFPEPDAHGRDVLHPADR